MPDTKDVTAKKRSRSIKRCVAPFYHNISKLTLDNVCFRITNIIFEVICPCFKVETVYRSIKQDTRKAV